jgi:REP element-mobilizing transposase RayT
VGKRPLTDEEYQRALHGLPNDLIPRLPLRGTAQSPALQRTHQKIIVAGHLVISGYGHWLPNDPRGSGSTGFREDGLDELGPIHTGRKRVQPPRDELREFYRKAEPLLQHKTLWFDGAKRQAVADGFAQIVRDLGYTVWACAVCRNHAHLVVRRHRDSLEVIWDRFASGAAKLLKERFPPIARDHPVWAHRPYVVYVYDPLGIRSRIKYVDDNPLKERLPRQSHRFVQAYDGWPYTPDTELPRR